MIVAALIAGWLLRNQQRPLRLSLGQRLGIAVGALVGATFAAKLPFVWGRTEFGLAAWMADGKTILWALTGGYIGVEVAKWSLHVRQRTGDTFVIPVAIAIAIGRLGCLTFGCCYGLPTELPWGVCFVTAEDGGTLARHPTQVYEVAFHVTAALTACWMQRRGIMKTNLMPAYIAAYGIYRFLTEFLRPEERVWAGLTFYQLSAVPITLAMLMIIAFRRLRSEPQAPLLPE